GSLAAMVPNASARCEGDPVASLLQPPAEVHIVPGLAELWIEAVDRLEHLAAEGHVAAGDVLRDLLTLQNVRRLPRRRGDASGQPAVIGSEVGPPDRGRAAALQLIDEVRQPIRIGEAVRVGVSDDLARG